MKNFLLIIFLACCGYLLPAQNIEKLPSSECIDCFNPYYSGFPEFSTGTKWGLSFGLVKPITSKFDLVTQLGYHYWNYETIRFYDIYGIAHTTSNKEDNQMLQLSIGQRVHWLQFQSSSLYVGTSLNFQTYLSRRHNRLGLSIEPKLGWMKSIGEKGEFVLEAGLDQHLTAYDSYHNRRPGRFGFNVGYNVRLGKREK